MIDFRRLLAALIEEKVEFVIVGGVAATLHGSARLTSDLDIVYGRSREDTRRLVAALAPLKPYLRGAPKGLPFHLDVETVRAGLNFTLTTDAGPLDVESQRRSPIRRRSANAQSPSSCSECDVGSSTSMR